ncbi:MAG: hypothetical protein RL134_1954 [Actinomycetota bacterium]
MSSLEATRVRGRWVRGLAALAAVALTIGVGPGAASALAAPKPKPNEQIQAEPAGVSFTLEGCRNDGTITLPNGAGAFVCPDGVYTSGNLGKGWAELDLVPYRLTANAGNSAPTDQTYTIAYAVDHDEAGAPGYDVLSTVTVNSTLSIGTCPAPVVGSESIATPGIGGISETMYRTLTITQQKSSTCVYDFYARLALGSHLFPGSSLHANLALPGAGGSLDTGGIGARDVSIPVRELEPQSIAKDMSGSRGSDHTWNVTKQVAPASLSLGNTCAVDGEFASVSVDETVTWTKNPATPGAATLITNVYATNPASRPITVTASDVMFAGAVGGTQLDDTTFASVVIPPRTTLLVGTHTFEWAAPTTTSVSDRATATYVDTATSIPIPGSTEATATATIQDNGPVSNATAVIDDSQGVSGSGLSFSIDSVEGATGTFDGYTLGATTTGPVGWVSDTQSDSGSVTFRKTVYAAKGTIETSGELSDTASVSGSDGFTAAATASAAVVADALATLSLDKSIPAGIITRGTEWADFTFDVVTGDDTAASPSLRFDAGEIYKSTQVDGLVPGIYQVVERTAAGWLPQDPQTIDLSGAICAGSVSFDNEVAPADAEALKVTVPGGFEAGWAMALYRGDDTTPIAEGTTDDSGVVDFGEITEEGTYTVLETEQDGWSGSGEACTFEVDLPADAGTTFTCTYTNTFQPDVELTKTGDELSKVGDQVNYAITLANTSPTGATAGVPDLDCRVTDAPLGFDESVTLGADDSQTWTPAAFTIPEGSDPYVNEASASCTFPGSEDEVATAQASWSTELFQPEITVTKVADREYTQVGETITYTVTIANTGSADSPALVPDDSTPFVDPLVPGVVLPADCDSLAVGEDCDVTYDYVVAADDSVIPNTASVLFHPEGFPNDVRGSDSANVTVVRPAFTVTKTCSTPNFPVGTTAIFTVEVVNTGDAVLRMTLDDSISGNGNPAAPYPLTGANTTATPESDVTNAGITFVDGGARFTLDPGKRAIVEISVATANVALTNSIAATGRLGAQYAGTSYESTLTAQDVCIDAPPDGATRTIGFWRTHLSFVRQVLATRPLPSAAVTGTSPLGVNSTSGAFVNGSLKLSTSGRFTMSSVADVMGVFWANNAQNSNGKKRSTICQARITTGKQLLGAILNQGFGNAKPLPQVGSTDLIRAALAIMDTPSVTDIRTIGKLLDEYNNGGDSTTIVIPGDLTIGKADPTAARTLARLAAGDC